MKRTCTIFLLLAVTIAPAYAGETATVEQRAHDHFEAGRALYHTGNYEEAMREFALGYDLANKPEFFINIGLCHYRLGHLTQARDHFRRFLTLVPADNPSRTYVEEQLAEVEQALHAQAPAIVEPPHAAPMPRAAPAAPPATTSPALDANAAPAVTRAPRRSWIRRNWWIIPVGVVVAGGVAVGLGVGLTRNNPCAGSGACVAVPGN